MTARKPPYAGLRHWYPNVLTGGRVGLYDAAPAGLDTGGDRWATVCEDHGAILAHATFDVARAWGRSPEEWCEGCTILHLCEHDIVAPVTPIRQGGPA